MSTETKTTSTEFSWDNSPFNFALHGVTFLDHHLNHVTEQIAFVENQLTKLKSDLAETTTMRAVAFDTLKQEVEKFNASHPNASLDSNNDVKTLASQYHKYCEVLKTQTA